MFWNALAAAHDAKRMRTAQWQPTVDGSSQQAGLSLGEVISSLPVGAVAAQQASLLVSPAPPVTTGGDDITRRIFDALQGHKPCAASPATSSTAQPAVPRQAEPELGNRLLDSLRTLLPAGALTEAAQNSSEGQELARVVQNMAPADATPAPIPVLALEDSSLAPRSRENRKRLPEVTSPQNDEVDSDDGEPHRLPPGFGAVPEDIVEERARQREEQRVLQLKSTQPCRFGKRCKRRDCPNAHTEGRDIDTAWNPCAFGRRCKRKDCFYDHPEGRMIDDNPEKGMCKFGVRCSRPDCLYDHPDGRATLSGPDPRICYFCHDPGHIATDCPRNPESWNHARGELPSLTRG